MHLVVLLQPMPSDDRWISALASVLEISLYEARTRGVGDGPRILAVVAARDVADATCAKLRDIGFTVAVIDARSIEHDADRDIVASLSFGESSFQATLRGGSTRTVPYDSLSLLQHGARTLTSTSSKEVTTKRFDVGRAVISGGLVRNKTTTTTQTESVESREVFLYLHEAGVHPAIALYERGTNWSFLGAALQPSAAANFTTTLEEFKRRARHARVDARMLRPVSVGAMPLAPSGLHPAEWKSDVIATLLSLNA